MNSQEFSILAEPDESWHSFCVHYQEITSGSHVDFAAATGLPRSHSRACSHPIFKYLGRWGGITDHIVGGKKLHITNQVQFVCFNNAVSTELMVMLRLKLHGAVECIDRNALSGTVSSSLPPICLPFPHCSVVPPVMESRGVSLLSSAHRRSSISDRTIAYSFTGSVMFLWSKPWLRCLSHIFKWIPWAFGSVVSIIHFKTSM